MIVLAAGRRSECHRQACCCQALQQIAVRGHAEPRHHALSNYSTNITNRCQLLCLCCQQCLHAAKLHSQRSCHLCAYMTDTQSKEQLVQLIRLARSNRCEQLVRRLLAHALKLQDILLLQAVQVRCITHQTGIQQRIDNRRPTAFNIHRLTADEVNQAFASQRRTVRIRAADSCLRALTLNTPAAIRTFRRYLYLFFFSRALFRHHAQHLRNNLSGLIDKHPVADADILRADKILIMQGCTADNAAAQLHRRQHCRRRQHSCASHAPVDILQRRFCLLRRIFISRRPARVLACCAQDTLLINIVDLDNSAVSIISKSLTQLVKISNIFNRRVDIFYNLIVLADLEAIACQRCQRFAMLFPCALSHKIIGKKAQAAAGRHLRVKLTQTARRRITRIGKFALAPLRTLLVELHEGMTRHIHLAAHV